MTYDFARRPRRRPAAAPRRATPHPSNANRRRQIRVEPGASPVTLPPTADKTGWEDLPTAGAWNWRTGRFSTQPASCSTPMWTNNRSIKNTWKRCAGRCLGVFLREEETSVESWDENALAPSTDRGTREPQPPRGVRLKTRFAQRRPSRSQRRRRMRRPKQKRKAQPAGTAETGDVYAVM